MAAVCALWSRGVAADACHRRQKSAFAKASQDTLIVAGFHWWTVAQAMLRSIKIADFEAACSAIQSVCAVIAGKRDKLRVSIVARAMPRLERQAPGPRFRVYARRPRMETQF
jgi:hypothetical protein